MGRIAEWFERIGRYAWVAIIAGVTLAIGVLRMRHTAEAVGKAKGRAAADRERLDEQVKQGDGGGIYRDITKRGGK